MNLPPSLKPVQPSKSASKPDRKMSASQLERLREARRAASARYREKNRAKVLEAGRLRAAKRRAELKGDEAMQARAREASARYRAENRLKLALKQRKVRKRAYIKKHGIHAYIQRRFDAPIPNRFPEPLEEPPQEESTLDEEPSTSLDTAPLICDYYDPFLKRW